MSNKEILNALTKEGLKMHFKPWRYMLAMVLAAFGINDIAELQTNLGFSFALLFGIGVLFFIDNIQKASKMFDRGNKETANNLMPISRNMNTYLSWAMFILLVAALIAVLMKISMSASFTTAIALLVGGTISGVHLNKIKKMP